MDAFSQMIFERGLGIGERQGIEIGERQGIEIGERQGIAIGEERGIAIGESASRRAIAAEMLRRGMSEELTASITGLDAESVKRLASVKTEFNS